MIGLLGRQGPAATLGQPCPQMTKKSGTLTDYGLVNTYVGPVLEFKSDGGDFAKMFPLSAGNRYITSQWSQ